MIRPPALAFTLLGSLLAGPMLFPAGAQATTLAPAPSATSEMPTDMVPSPADIDKAALRLAQELDGVLRNCPAAYVSIGTPDKRCVGVASDVETVRQRIGAALGSDLYGVWRSRDDQRTVFNWIKMPSGTVYLRVAADDAGAGRSLVYLDAPTVPASAVTTPPASASPTAAKPATSSAAPASSTPTVTRTFQAPSPSADGTAKVQPGSPAAGKSLASVPFTRTLELKSPRLSGPDVLAAQNRLIALTLGSQGGQGDGWYGPNTAKAVRDFQAANHLKVTGVLDRATWTLLFSAAAKPFKSAGK